jgi:hypothetical protein
MTKHSKAPSWLYRPEGRVENIRSFRTGASKGHSHRLPNLTCWTLTLTLSSFLTHYNPCSWLLHHVYYWPPDQISCWLSQHICWWLLDNIYCYYTTYTAYKLHLLLSDLIYSIRPYMLLLDHTLCRYCWILDHMCNCHSISTSEGHIHVYYRLLNHTSCSYPQHTTDH